MSEVPTHGGGTRRQRLRFKPGLRYLISSLRLLCIVCLAWLTGCSQTGPEDTGTGQTALESSSPSTGGGSQSSRTVWLMMKRKPLLNAARAEKDWKKRGQQVYQALTQAAQQGQVAVLDRLRVQNVEHKSFWGVNTIKVTASDAVIQSLANHPDVERVVEDFRYHIPPPQVRAADSVPQDTEWNLDSIGAPQAWDIYGTHGEGIVVASVDTGVDYQHPALVQQYRGLQADGSYDHNYSWYDPASVCGSPSDEPCDNDGHGTHTMGTMVGDDGGDNQIGVAPGARWIAAKGCEESFCSTESLLSAGQWILAPTDLNGENPRPDMRPHVVNNSWGGPGGDDFYSEIVDAWVAAGIFPAFSAGNSGPSCSSTGSPGDYPNSYAAGAYDQDEFIAFFSSRGQSAYGVTKPDIAAPGVDVRSSVPGGYAYYSGTSMASPHIAGSVALLWSASIALEGDVDATRAILDQSAQDHDDTSCGGTPEDNNVWGEGKLDVLEALDLAPMGPTGTLAGVVSSAEGEPLAGAVISATGPFERQTATDASGSFSLRLPIGAYDVSVRLFGYLTQTTNVEILEDQSTNLDFTLDAAPTHSVSGVVTDTLGDAVVGASVRLSGTPLDQVQTGEDGSYLFAAVPEGTYPLLIQAGGCYADYSETIEVTGDVVQNATLTPVADDYGYQCRPTSFEYIDGDTQLFLSGDDSQTSVQLPFEFLFYGESYETLQVTTNGYASFENDFFAEYYNTPIPSPQTPNAALYPLWDDLIIDSESSVYTRELGEAPNRRFVIEWRNIAFLDGGDFPPPPLPPPGPDAGIPEPDSDIPEPESGTGTGTGTDIGEPPPPPLPPGKLSLDGGTDGGLPPPPPPPPPGAGGRVSFELVLYESGEILMQYLEAGPSAQQQGASATVGIEDAQGAVALQYSYNEPSLNSETAILFEFPFSGFVEGIVSDANDGLGVSGATLSATNDEGRTWTAHTNSDGHYRMQLTEGEYQVEISKSNYESAVGTLFVLEDDTVMADFVLNTPKGVVSPPTLQVLLPIGERRDYTVSLSNQGSGTMEFEVRESGGARQQVLATSKLERNPDANPNAQSTRDLYTEQRPGKSAFTPSSPGDVLKSFPPSGLGLAWGIGLADNLWLSDVYVANNHEFTTDGDPTGLTHQASWSGEWPADMAFDSNRGLVCQLAVGADNGIYCWDPETGDVVESIGGSQEWTWTSQRGLAYNALDDTFYVGGWNDSVIYKVAGVSSSDPGEVISSCTPADTDISGLAYNSAANVLWVATNSPMDTIYELNADDCTVLSTLPPPQPGGFNGAGIEIDPEGNLWAIMQYPNTVYLIESGVPAFGDIPWLTTDLSDGQLDPGEQIDFTVSIDTTDLEAGLYLGTLFITTNSGRQPTLRIPVSLVVTDYQQGVNVGSNRDYTDPIGDLWAPDQRYSGSGWGYVQRSRTKRTRRNISGTDEQPLFNTQRIDPYAYRFDDVPNGVYEVDLDFAELQRVRFGQRLYDVILENDLVLPAHDIVYEVDRLTADQHHFFVEVTDNRMDVRLIPRSGSRPPVINALRVTRRPDR